MSKTANRLFQQFQPSHYDLRLELDREKMSFEGSVVIKGKKVGRPSKRITLHQRGLKITSATITHHDKKGDTVIKTSRINHLAGFTEARLHCEQILYPGTYTLSLEFSGSITEQMLGIYPCNFTVDGIQKSLIATQFESHYARNAFPCIDEPEAKAIFELTLVHDNADTVLSNTPTAKQEGLSKALTETKFEPTPKMSAYLLAFVCGDMHYVEAKTKDGTVVRSWSTTAQDKKLLNYSLHEAVKVLDFFTEYFGTPYPLAKCDQVALPDFDAGAMENWGLITYREIALLIDPDNRSISSEQYVSLVVAHELSHQWFGNLVTMKWWDDLWLNESFASLMEHIALDVLHPDWKQWELYTASDVISTSSRDIYSDISPVGVTVTDPELIDTLFDPGIVYAKGGRLLKMLREYIGDEAFRAGLAEYFKLHAYGNATRDDLWKQLSKSSKEDIASLMNPWISQPGMPLVSVDQKNGTISLEQSRFCLDKTIDESNWPVPLLATPNLGIDIFENANSTLEVAKNSDFILLNQYASGHYVTHYKNPAHRTFLASLIKERKITTEGRINLLNDMYLLARRGDSPLTDALDIVLQSAEEDRDSVWALVSRTIGSAMQLTEGNTVAEKSLRDVRQALASKQHEQLGWDDKADDDPNTKLLRHTMLAFMIGGEDVETLAETRKRYQAQKDIGDLPAETRALVLGAMVKHAEPGVVEKLLKAYGAATPDLQLDISSAVTNTKEPDLAKEILGEAFGSTGFVRTQDIMRWFVMFLRNRHTRTVAWAYLQDNWSWFLDTIGESKSFDYLPTYCAGMVTTKEAKDAYDAFFEPKKTMKVLKQNIIIGQADSASRVAWRTRDEKLILDWLKKNT